MDGTTFLTKPNHINTVLYLWKNDDYIVEQKNLIEGDIRNDIIYSKDEIEKFLAKQEEISIAVNSDIDFNKKMQEKERLQKEYEEFKNKEYNNTFGYTDNMKDMQKGKILKYLNKQTRYYNDENKPTEVVSQKDFVLKKLKEGYIPEYQKDQKEKYLLAKKSKNICNIITKTNYDYACYLMSINILEIK